MYLPDSGDQTLKDDHLGYKQTHHHEVYLPNSGDQTLKDDHLGYKQTHHHEVYLPNSGDQTLKDDHLGYKQTHHHLLLHKSDASVKDSLPITTELHKTNDRTVSS